MIGRGVRAGNATPCHEMARKPGTVSAIAGISGALNQRSADVTASARTLPPRACGSTVGILPKVMCTWPPITSITACAPPLYGMCTMSVPVITLNISPERCSEVPTPEDAIGVFARLALQQRDELRHRGDGQRVVDDQQVG